MFRTSRLTLLAATAMLAVSCGSDSDSSSSSSSSSLSASTAPTTVESTTPASAAPTEPDELRLLPADATELGAPVVPAPTAGGADAATLEIALAAYADFGTDAAPGEFPRTIRHAGGETTIGSKPERVVVLDTGELDAALQLGVTPVGAAEYNAAGLPQYLVDAAQGVDVVGTTAEPNFEAIAALQPDLILSSELRHGEIYDTLAAIAPTVLVTRPGVTFKHNFVLYAQALGLEDTAAAVVADYEAAVRSANAALPEPRPVVGVVQLRADGLRFYQRSNFLGLLLTDLGLPRPETENVDAFAIDLGEEELATYADGDWLIAAVVNADKNPFADGILAGALWNNLPVVQSGDVALVDSSLWVGGVGYGAAFEIIEQLQVALAAD